MNLDSNTTLAKAESFKRSMRKFKTLKRRLIDLKDSEVARQHKEMMIDGFDTIEIIEDLLLEMKQDDSLDVGGTQEDINYYLSQLEENVHELERGQSSIAV
ncbi:MAG: hypothetical protein CME64_16720 [Halobacteriovoraceae bacterium]|nr:hypothetical protein [Halobacteriovoraceae bacterium]|tara:strand:+ start:173935 stop:174237 length:303 start_codon:yes stop_codon:yes gene_type:complete